MIISLMQIVAVEAAEVRVLSAAAMRSVINELGPQFERSSGHKLVMEYETSGALRRRIERGEAFDVAIMTTPLADELVKQGKIAARARASIARSGIGVLVRVGAPKPDISSPEAFKAAMLSAKSIGYSREGATSMYLATLFERMGIADQMKAKTRYVPAAGRGAQFIAEGGAELGLSVISAIEHVPGAELLGPLPRELQNYVEYSAGIGAFAKEQEAGIALIEFLKAPAAIPVLKANGMEPISP